MRAKYTMRSKIFVFIGYPNRILPDFRTFIMNIHIQSFITKYNIIMGTGWLSPSIFLQMLSSLLTTTHKPSDTKQVSNVGLKTFLDTVIIPYIIYFIDHSCMPNQCNQIKM